MEQSHVHTLIKCDFILHKSNSIASSSLDKNGHIRGETPSSSGDLAGGGCFSIIVSEACIALEVIITLEITHDRYDRSSLICLMKSLKQCLPDCNSMS